MRATQAVPAATLTYTCGIGDTRPAICARFWPQTGYSNFGQLMADIMTANPQVADWCAPLEGITVVVPTVPGG